LSEDKINKFNLIKKIPFKEAQFNKDPRKKTQGNPCYFKKKDKSYRKKVEKNVIGRNMKKKQTLKKKTSQAQVNLVNLSLFF
jgi:predicted RNA-binding protein YlxR (DUF448 family)